jgi:hypothetical protein
VRITILIFSYLPDYLQFVDRLSQDLGWLELYRNSSAIEPNKEILFGFVTVIIYLDPW